MLLLCDIRSDTTYVRQLQRHGSTVTFPWRKRLAYCHANGTPRWTGVCQTCKPERKGAYAFPTGTRVTTAQQSAPALVGMGYDSALDGRGMGQSGGSDCAVAPRADRLRVEAAWYEAPSRKTHQ